MRRLLASSLAVLAVTVADAQSPSPVPPMPIPVARPAPPAPGTVEMKATGTPGKAAASRLATDTATITAIDVAARIINLQRRSGEAQTFKVGPDFLDPSYLAIASGRPCYNLDGWMMGRDYVEKLVARATTDADITVIEGVMGLFDGAEPDSIEGSTAQIAAWLKAPVMPTTAWPNNHVDPQALRIADDAIDELRQRRGAGLSQRKLEEALYRKEK